MHLKLPGLVSDAMKTYNNAKSKTLETKDNPKKKKKKKKKKKNLWPLFMEGVQLPHG